MPKAVDGRKLGPQIELTADAVRAWIEDNPDFLVENLDLLSALSAGPAREMPGVVDLQRYIVDGLRTSLKRQEAREREILIAAEERARAVARTQDAALLALKQKSLPALAERIASGYPVMLAATAAALVLEGGAEQAAKDLLVLPRSKIETLIAPGETIALGRLGDAGRGVLGDRFATVESVAVLRLESTRRRAYLVLGSSSETDFQPDHGTELLAFLGSVLSLAIDRWSRSPR